MVRGQVQEFLGGSVRKQASAHPEVLTEVKLRPDTEIELWQGLAALSTIEDREEEVSIEGDSATAPIVGQLGADY